jgi:hypothetical protein
VKGRSLRREAGPQVGERDRRRREGVEAGVPGGGLREAPAVVVDQHASADDAFLRPGCRGDPLSATRRIKVEEKRREGGGWGGGRRPLTVDAVDGARPARRVDGVDVLLGDAVVEAPLALVGEVAQAVPLRARLGVERPDVVIDAARRLGVEVVPEGLAAEEGGGLRAKGPVERDSGEGFGQSVQRNRREASIPSPYLTPVVISLAAAATRSLVSRFSIPSSSLSP